MQLGREWPLLLEIARWLLPFRVMYDMIRRTSLPFIQSSTKGLNPNPFGRVGLPLRDLPPSAMPAMRSLLSVRPISLRRMGS